MTETPQGRVPGVIDGLPFLWFEADTAGLLLGIGGAELALLGLQHLRFGASIFSEKSFPVSRANFRRCLAGGPLTATYFVGDRHLETYVRPLTDAHGTATGVSGFSLDISERVRVETTLDNARLAAIASSRKLATKVGSILRHVRQGILTFGQDLKIDQEFSPAVAALFHTDVTTIGGRDVVDFCLGEFLSPDEAGLLKETLRVAFGPGLDYFESCRTRLPTQTELVRGGERRLLKLEWVAMPDDNAVVERCLVCVTDLTAEISFKNRIQSSIDETSRLLAIARQITGGNGGIVRQFVGEALAQLPQFFPAIWRQNDSATTVARDVHSLKGSMRMMGFSQAAHIFHEFESCMFASPLDEGAAQRILAQASAELLQIKATLDNLSGGGAAVRNGAGPVSLVRFIGDQVQAITTSLSEVGAELAAVECRDSVVYWDDKTFASVSVIVMHAMTNAIDHGYVIPMRAGRVLPRIEIRVSAEIRDEHVVVEIADRGAGLDRERLARVAALKGLSDLFAQDPSEVLFHDGTSTATEMSLTSGRGVGLPAVRAAAASLGGTAVINFPASGGATLTVRIPKGRALSR